jgi:hypothetical protein
MHGMLVLATSILMLVHLLASPLALKYSSYIMGNVSVKVTVGKII